MNIEETAIKTMVLLQYSTGVFKQALSEELLKVDLSNTDPHKFLLTVASRMTLISDESTAEMEKNKIQTTTE